jgi:hypothetical protein
MEYTPAVAERLQDALGQRLTAYSVGILSPKDIGRFAKGEEQPDDETANKLTRLLEDVVEPVLAVDSPEVLRALIIGSNSGLDDRAVIEVFREGLFDAAQRAIQDFVRS